MGERQWKTGDLGVTRTESGTYVGVYVEPGDCLVGCNASGRPHWHSQGGAMLDSSYLFRPLAAIDPEDRDEVERLADMVTQQVTSNNTNDLITGALQAALRSCAKSTPPKPDEPMGLGAVVEAANGDRWTRVDSTGGDAVYVWVCEADDETTPFRWQDFDAVRILSAGVTDGGDDQ